MWARGPQISERNIVEWSRFTLWALLLLRMFLLLLLCTAGHLKTLSFSTASNSRLRPSSVNSRWLM